jgi:hypothetical protein
MFNIPEDIPLKECCLQRVNRKNRNVVVAHRGTSSPMVEVEAHLVDIILHYSRMRQPITPKVGIALANSLVIGTEIEHEVRDWRKKSLPTGAAVKYDPDKAVNSDKILCTGWWRDFLKRNPNISTKKAVRFDSLREDWCSISNFEVMYHEVYEAMVQSGVAIKVDEAVFVNADGNIAQSSDNAVGWKMTYLLTHPD